MTDKSLSSDDICAALSENIAFIDEAIENIRQDKVTDLEALETQVETLCEAVAALPAEDAEKCEADMARMIARLDVLAEELKNFQDRAEDRIAAEEASTDRHNSTDNKDKTKQ